MDLIRFQYPPCYSCGYNGPNYFDPRVHHCAAEYHLERETADRRTTVLESQLKAKMIECVRLNIQLGSAREASDDAHRANATLDGELSRLRASLERAESTLRAIKDTPHQSYETDAHEGTAQYKIGVADGHRCAAKIARAYFAEKDT